MANQYRVFTDENSVDRSMRAIVCANARKRIRPAWNIAMQRLIGVKDASAI